VKIFIFSGNAKQSSELAKNLNLDRCDFTHISSAETLFGVGRGIYIKTGTFYDHEHYYDILRQLRIREMVEISIA
jgi:hypothetical protein